jgi:hypothetical protein
MSAMQDIFNNLAKISGDKKKLLDNSYAEKSSWLKAEFDVVRNLIQRNPRDESNSPPRRSGRKA